MQPESRITQPHRKVKVRSREANTFSAPHATIKFFDPTAANVYGGVVVGENHGRSAKGKKKSLGDWHAMLARLTPDPPAAVRGSLNLFQVSEKPLRRVLVVWDLTTSAPESRPPIQWSGTTPKIRSDIRFEISDENHPGRRCHKAVVTMATRECRWSLIWGCADSSKVDGTQITTSANSTR